MKALPLVAIVGRPNVGKSTLFNRFADKRVLVEDTPGITRDRIAEEIEAAGRRVLLVDTAGLNPDATAPIEVAVQQQVQEAITAADAIMLVVDGQAGRLPLEDELARQLRKSDRPVCVVVNKIDEAAHRQRLHEFHALGLEPLRAVSAEHGAGAWDALDELVAALPAADDDADAPSSESPAGGDGALRIALVGRPNVGKSTLMNRLLGAPRVVVSEVPGTTRDAVDALLEHGGRRYRFIDTAGLRRAARRSEHVERGSALMTLRAIERAELALLLLDAAHGPGDQDIRLLSLLRARGCATALLLNKWDRVEAARDPAAQRRLEAEITRRLRPFADTPLLRLSALTGRGATRILPLVRELDAAHALRIPTAALNRWLRDSVASFEPAMATRGARRRPVKLLYATQIGTRPPRIVVFCSEPSALQTHYLRFLEKKLRAAFPLAGCPVRLRLRRRHPAAG